jgi:hypothetical protein
MLRGPGSLPMGIMTQGQARMITVAEETNRQAKAVNSDMSG